MYGFTHLTIGNKSQEAVNWFFFCLFYHNDRNEKKIWINLSKVVWKSVFDWLDFPSQKLYSITLHVLLDQPTIDRKGGTQNDLWTHSDLHYVKTAVMKTHIHVQINRQTEEQDDINPSLLHADDLNSVSILFCQYAAIPK